VKNDDISHDSTSGKHCENTEGKNQKTMSYERNAMTMRLLKKEQIMTITWNIGKLVPPFPKGKTSLGFFQFTIINTSAHQHITTSTHILKHNVNTSTLQHFDTSTHQRTQHTVISTSTTSHLNGINTSQHFNNTRINTPTNHDQFVMTRKVRHTPDSSTLPPSHPHPLRHSWSSGFSFVIVCHNGEKMLDPSSTPFVIVRHN